MHMCVQYRAPHLDAFVHTMGGTRLSYGGKSYLIPKLTPGTSFVPAQMAADVCADLLPGCCREVGLGARAPTAASCDCSPFWEDLGSIWESKKLGKKRRKPLALLNDVSDPCWRQCFEWDSEGLSVLDMPIKFPGSQEYRVPRECESFLPVIRFIAQVEQTINPQAIDYHAFLTIDQQTVAPGRTQRVPGLHVDGFQGARVDPKVVLGHSYTVSCSVPTRFILAPFDGLGDVDPTKVNLFCLMDEAVLRNGLRAEDQFSPVPFQVSLFDGYTVHQAVPHAGTKPERRTFFRLSFSVREFDRLGNAHNPMFDYDWKMVPRDVRLQHRARL